MCLVGQAPDSEPTKVKCNYIYPKCNYIWGDVITFRKFQPTKPQVGIQM